MRNWVRPWVAAGLMLFLAFTTTNAWAADAPGRVALIYNGIGSTEGGPEGVAALAGQVGLKVQFISRAADLPPKLKNAALFAIGGTEDDTEPMRKSFTPDVLQALRTFVQGGGRYMGFCGGGYMASKGWDEKIGPVPGFGLVSAWTDFFMDDYDPRILPIKWKGQTRNIFYQGGPKFMMEPGPEPAEIVALYSDGSVAAVLAGYGKGKAFVSGPHPEATIDWLEEDGLSSHGWSSSMDLAVEALKDLLSDRPLKK